MSTGHTYRSQVEFSSEQVEEERPVTESLLPPDRAYDLGFFSRVLRFDDGAQHEIWGFETATSGRSLPGPLVRVGEGQLLHARFEPSKGPHTIHWHGMEPDPRNDGVGHTSFEIGDFYTYQLRPETGRPGDVNFGAAGTYFYHCHVNTVLHAQMGMFGPLVVDPVVHADYPVVPGVTRRPFVDGPEYDADTEMLLVPYSVDPRWHTLHHAAGLSGEDVGLNRFEPSHFYLLGGELARRPSRDGVWQPTRIRCTAPGTTYPSGEARRPTLVRVLNANYYPTTMVFTDGDGQRVPMAEIVAHDGRPYRDTSRRGEPSPPIRETSGPLMTSILAFGAAERYDLLLHPPAAGTYTLTVRWEHWITKQILGTRTIPVVAS